MGTGALQPMGGAQVLGVTLAQALGVTAAQALGATAAQVRRAMVTTMMMTMALHPEEASPPEKLPSHLLMLHYIMGRLHGSSYIVSSKT